MKKEVNAPETTAATHDNSGNNTNETQAKNRKKERDPDLPNWMIDKNIVNEVEFCKFYLGSRNLKYISGHFYSVNGEVTSAELAYDIGNIIMKYVYFGLSKKVKNIIDALKIYCFCEPFQPKENEIHVNSGTLLTDGRFFPGKRFCLNRLNVNYDPEIWHRPPYYPEAFLTFLYDLLEPDDVITLQEYLGYLLIPSTRGQAALFIIGSGGEGKSRLGVVLQDIFGTSMVTGNFQRVETDRFFRYNLQNKLLMLDDDMQMNALPSTGYIKNLITAEIPIDIEAKGQQSEQARIYSRFLCFGNGSPKALYDRSDGFARRLIILTTKPKPENRRDDPFIANKFLAEKEKIFCWMLDGMKRLIDHDFHFTLSEKTRKNISEVMSENCNIIDFLKEPGMVEFGSQFRVSSSDLFDAYDKWCSENALTALKRETFINWLKASEKKYNIVYTNTVTNGSGKRIRGFAGLKINKMF